MINIITTNSDNLYQQASKKLLNLISDKRNSDHKVLIFLSGGSSIKLYYLLSDWIASKKDIGGNLAFAQVDERFQPFHGKSKLPASPVGRQITNSKNNEQINAYMIAKTGLWDVCQEKNIPYYLISQIGSLEEAADGYNKIISDLFEKYDYKIAILGIGEDGHTAGLLPGYEKDWNTDRYVVGYNLGQNNALALFCQQKFRQRITVTPKALKQLDYALVAAAGRKKRKVIKRLLKKDSKGDFDKFPAAIIKNMKNTNLYSDFDQ